MSVVIVLAALSFREITAPPLLPASAHFLLKKFRPSILAFSLLLSTNRTAGITFSATAYVSRNGSAPCLFRYGERATGRLPG